MSEFLAHVITLVLVVTAFVVAVATIRDILDD